LKTKNLIIGSIFYLIFNSISYSQIVEFDSVKNISEGNILSPDSIRFDSDIFNNDRLVSDTGFVITQLKYGNDSISGAAKKRSSSEFSEKVIYSAKDSTIYSIDGQKVFLFGEAVINYEDIELKAAYIEVDMAKNIMYAEGVPDSTGVIIGQPEFTQGGETMKAKNITYNVKTDKGFIKGLYTEQEDGYLHSDITKKEANNSINLYHGKYSTCELEEPHFYLWLSKGKVIPDKAIVASFSYMVMEGIPLYPIMVPFGFFPTSKEKASGFLIPKFGEEDARGFFLKDGGYYFALNDYFDLAVRGSAYSKGSWEIGAQSKYTLRYKFTGNFNVAYSKVKIGEPELSNYEESNQYSLVWSHTQDQKAMPNSNFSASVNFSSMDNNRYNSTNSNDYLTNTTNSSISFRKTFANTPFSMSMNAAHTQNSKTRIVTFTSLPQMTFNMNRIFPFRRKVAVGKPKWYENVGITYAGNFKNSISAPDSIIYTDAAKDLFKNGMQHSIPLSTSVKFLKFLNLSPSFNFTDRMYFDRTFKSLGTYEKDGVERDTVLYKEQKGFYNVYDYSLGMGLGTTIYGMFQFKSKKIKALRHVATPSVSFSYRPDFQEAKWGYYIPDPTVDNTKNTVFYSPYKEGIYGVPGAGKSGMVNFSLNNNLEMKVANKKDTVNKEAKIKILEGLSFSTSYNMMADVFKWSPLSISARTTLFKILAINISSTGNFYALDDSTGKPINTFQFDRHPGQLLRITNVRASTGISINSEKLFGKTDTKTENTTGEQEIHHNEVVGIPQSSQYYEYDYFKVPWNMRFDYSFGLQKPGFVSDVVQTLSFSGDLSLTPKWKIAMRSGWDFNAKQFSYTSFNLSRDLHCWVATLSLVPFGDRQSYSFSIGAKSSILQDLKYDKNQSWYDNAY
jgi:lipopolysaccharide assembly outer membrane protein LptD (OstA)